MLFFGGFGSVVPYIVYLSLMWICILIGIRGQFRGILSFRQPQENKIESVSVNLQEDRVAHFFNVPVKKQKPAAAFAMGQFLSFDFSPFIEDIFHPCMSHFGPVSVHIIDACGLRAPPKILSA